MAKQIGSEKFKGTVDGFSFYHDRLHGYLVRRTGGITSKQYHQDSRYMAARDASTEFAAVSGAGKLIRDAFGEFGRQVKDGAMVNRMNKELVALKQLDHKHTRGERKPETMLTNAGANKYFRIFQFNESMKVYKLTDSFPLITKDNNKLTISNLRLVESAFPEVATHAGLTMVRTVIDFETGCFKTVSSEMAFVSKGNQKEHALFIDELPNIKGIEIICLQILFFNQSQLVEGNGDLVQLKGKVHAMGILAVNESQIRVIQHIRRKPSFRYSRKCHQPIRQKEMKPSCCFNFKTVPLANLLIDKYAINNSAMVNLQSSG